MKTGKVGDDMIGWHDQHQRIAILRGDPFCGDGDRRRGVAPFRLQQDGARCLANARNLLFDQIDMGRARHDKRWCETVDIFGAQQGFLHHRPVGDERQKLLGTVRMR